MSVSKVEGIFSRIIYDYCSKSASLESALGPMAVGRQKYLLRAGIRDDGRYCGGELYYRLENYFIDYVKNLCQVSI